MAQDFTGTLKDTFGGEPFVSIAVEAGAPGLHSVFEGPATVSSRPEVARRGVKVSCNHPAASNLAYYIHRASRNVLYASDAAGRQALLRKIGGSRVFRSRALALNNSRQSLFVSVAQSRVRVRLEVLETLADGVACRYTLRGHLS